MAREASEAAKMTSYERGVQETESWLAKEVVWVCRDYYTETWVKALNRGGVLADSELRRAENIFFLEDIQEVPVTLPPPVANTLCFLESFFFLVTFTLLSVLTKIANNSGVTPRTQL